MNSRTKSEEDYAGLTVRPLTLPGNASASSLPERLV